MTLGRENTGRGRAGRGWGPRAALLGSLTVVAALSGGCVTLKSFCGLEPPPVGIPCRIAVTWKNCLMNTQDPVNGGADLRGLAGRVYLFANECDLPVSGDGQVIVDLYDERPIAAGGPAVALERWVLSKDILKQLLRKDAIGWGYTLFLPWVKTYRPDLTQLHMRVCYVREDKTPLYASDSIHLNHGEQFFHHSSTTETTTKERSQTAATAAAPQPFVRAAVAQPAPQGVIEATPQPLILQTGAQSPVQANASPAWIGMAKR